MEDTQLEKSDNFESETAFGLRTKTYENYSDSSETHEVDAVALIRKKRTQILSNSDSDDDNKQKESNNEMQEVNKAQSLLPNAVDDSDSSDDTRSQKITLKSRIRKLTDDSDSNSDSKIPLKNIESRRIKGKRNKLQQKFKSLLTVREKRPKKFDSVEQSSSSGAEAGFEGSVSKKVKGSEQSSSSGDEAVLKNGDAPKKCKSSEQSSSSGDELASIEKIKQKNKERTMHLKSTIYDPDTSEEESSIPKDSPKQKKVRKSTKLISPKPVRMSAKQAMENMQKIKSESNRMLREKEVSLPYHRPRALSLKDIMSRRRPAVSSDGKALPIKMNEEQLKQYALMLEQRQKEMMELCKSESEEEEIPDDGKKENEETQNDSIYDDLVNLDKKIECKVISQEMNSNENINNIEHIKDEKEIDSCKNKNDKSVVIHNPPTCERQSIVDGNNDKTSDRVLNTLPLLENDDDKLEKHSESNTKADAINECDTEIIINTETNTCDDSAEMELTYNYSLETNVTVNAHNNIGNVCGEIENTKKELKSASMAVDSQLISLHYDTEKPDIENVDQIDKLKKDAISAINKEIHVNESTTNDSDERSKINIHEISAIHKEVNQNENKVNEIDKSNEFSDDDLNIDDIDRLIENAEILSQDNTDCNLSPMLVRDSQSLKAKPKLTGAPGMVIDLDGADVFAPKKSGVELLKERFTYFAKLKTPEEVEREKEKRVKPGLQHLKLKQELEEKIAEQRSLEWAKRLEEEKLQQKETDAVIGDESDAEDDIEKIDAKLDDIEDAPYEESSESEEEEQMLEDVEEQPRKRNPLIADEAEESDCDEVDNIEENKDNNKNNNEEEHNEDVDENEEDGDDEDEESEESSDEESDDDQSKPRKGRILRAFEDSDDEDMAVKWNNKSTGGNDVADKLGEKTSVDCESSEIVEANETIKDSYETHTIKDTQDEELQLAQRHKSFSEDLFTSQESVAKCSDERQKDSFSSDKELGTQTFSILNTDQVQNNVVDLPVPDNLIIAQSLADEGNLDHVVGMCSGSFSQSLVTSQYPTTQKSLDLGEDVLALCTGKFYDNQFVSQMENENISGVTCEDNQNLKVVDFHGNNENNSKMNTLSNTHNAVTSKNFNEDIETVRQIEESNTYIADDLQNTTKDHPSTEDKTESNVNTEDNILLKSILDELHDPEFDKEKPRKYFGDDDGDKENDVSNGNIQKKRLVIDSDEDEEAKDTSNKKKKLKKKKIEKRALQISDDEDEEDEVDEDISEVEDEEERLVEYDSEENEVVIQPENKKKKRKVADFFEQEAELTSEDEWVGSGDEDEAGLDRMEREAGDDENFNQGKLQRELEQIHMRDVLDQDKREVRMIQELLFEDGDLGGGGRQRKFRWRNADGGDENDASYIEFTDTQEEEFESEEQWRKQRHEREMFLKQMKQEDDEESLNITVNRTTLIKANLSSNKTMPGMILELNNGIEVVEKSEQASVLERKTSKDIPSPKKPFAMFQANYHNSLLTRGRGALARLASLAIPLAGDDDTPKVGSLAPSSKRNFVFAAITPDDKAPKVTKRKADTNVGTPRLFKKMKTEEQHARPRTSLLDHLNT